MQWTVSELAHWAPQRSLRGAILNKSTNHLTPSMTITFENNPEVSINGTCLQGYIETTYEELVNVFGEPTSLSGDKVTVEWTILFSDGTVASIYDWKRSETPMACYPWHIGGKSQRAVELVTNCMPVTV